MTETDVQTREGRLLTMGIAPRAAGALARAVAKPSGRPPEILDVSAWGGTGTDLRYNSV